MACSCPHRLWPEHAWSWAAGHACAHHSPKVHQRSELLTAAVTDYLRRAQLLRFQNGEICRLTEQVIFTDPYYDAPVNRHTSPQLDDLAAAFRADAQAKAAITALKAGSSLPPTAGCTPPCPAPLTG